jgi:hypothetical protein
LGLPELAKCKPKKIVANSPATRQKKLKIFF